MEINSEFQLTISPMLLSPVVSPAGNPSVGTWCLCFMNSLNCLMRSALLKLFFKKYLQSPPCVISLWRFQCVTIFLRLPQNCQTPQLLPPSPSPPPPPQASRPKRISALAAKYFFHDGIESTGDCFAGNEQDEYNNDSDSGDSDDEEYTWPPKAASFELVTWSGLL